MALDHSRLGLENEFLENKSGRIFLRSTSLLNKLWERVNNPFIPFIQHIWGETVLWGTVFIIQTSDRIQYFTVFQEKLHSWSFNIQDDRSTRGLLAKPLKKCPKSHIQPAGSHFCNASCSECLNEHTRVKLQHNKEIIMFIFYLMVLSICNL